jgi:hypothetical protein
MSSAKEFEKALVRQIEREGACSLFFCVYCPYDDQHSNGCKAKIHAIAREWVEGVKND